MRPRTLPPSPGPAKRPLTLALLVTTATLSAPTRAAAEATLTGQAGPPDASYALWYRAPATSWMTSALPIGNGRLGAMVFGGVAREHLQFNEKTLWTGSPRTYGAYQNFGDVYLDFPGLTSASGYRRELDLEQAIARVVYAVDATQFTREYFVSFPDDVLVMRLSASAPGKLDVDVSLANAHGGATAASGDTSTVAGTLELLAYEAQLRVVNEGGSLATSGDKLSVRNADAITILLAAATDYDASQASYKGASPHAAVAARVAAAARKSYAALRATHVTDHQGLFDRVSLHLGDTKPAVPTREALERYNGGARDPFLEVLYFQLGRYLTIASSRGLGLPSNLQGIWNDSNSPPWSSDLHNNINVQMNYWPTDPTNLGECFDPYASWLRDQGVVRDAWKQIAASKGRDGFAMNTQNNIFGYTDWEYHPEANAWFGQALWDHYRFTQDEGFLRDTAYPFMKGACDYWLSALVTDGDGKLVAPDSFSPEHGSPRRENGTTYAQTLIWQLFTSTLQASQVLGADAAYRTTLQAKLAQLDPGLRLGANVTAGGVSYGPLLREWKYQNDQLGEQHRHISHLIGLYPGAQISPLLDTRWSNAARASLVDRGDAGTGWSRAWKINTWARLLDGNHAKLLLENALQLTDVTGLDMSGATGGVYENLLDAHPPFQIDGNFGATAGIAEMLLQSHLDTVHVLPALPDAWPNGSVKGLVARGGFVVSIAWEGGVAQDTAVLSTAGRPCVMKSRLFTQPGGFAVVKLPENTPVDHTVAGDTISFATRTGTTYRVAARALLPVPSGSSSGSSSASSGSSGSSGSGSSGSSGGSSSGSSGGSSSGSSGGSGSGSSGGSGSGSSGGSGSGSSGGSQGNGKARDAGVSAGCASGAAAPEALPLLLAAAGIARVRRLRGSSEARR